MEGQVPGRVPGVLPLVWHRNDVAIDQVTPLRVSPTPARVRGRAVGIAFEPLGDIEEIKLFAPDEPGQRLALDLALVVRKLAGGQSSVKRVRIRLARVENLCGVYERLAKS